MRYRSVTKRLFLAASDGCPTIGDVVRHLGKYYVVSALVAIGRDTSDGQTIYRVSGVRDTPANRRLVAHLEGSI